MRDLDAVVQAGVLAPVSTLQIPPQSQANLVVVFKVYSSLPIWWARARFRAKVDEFVLRTRHVNFRKD
jgi:hypothetical protein